MIETSPIPLNTQYKSANVKAYDICVITAANEYQAQSYREQIRSRIDNGKLSQETKFIVIPDPYGKRIGSGGSTIFVLYRLFKQFCETDRSCRSAHDLLNKKRILILHSGGDSKRLPAYFAVGKVFIPLPIDFFPAFESIKQKIGFVTLFDLLLYNLMQLPRLNDGQLVIASGDVLLSFNAMEVRFGDYGVTGVAYPGPIDIASGHGVYIASPTLLDQNVRNVTGFLQKPTKEQLIQNDALDADNRAFVDTGVMNFSILERNLVGRITQEPKVRIRSDEVVWVCAPTRLDFAGGWSDTSPYCLEYGGSVLNAATKLNGQYPIQIIGKLRSEPVIRLNSIDLGEHAVVSELCEMLSYQDPSDWMSLPKAAFVTTGIIPEDSELSLQDILKKLGAGIDLTLFSAVPSGSGLGTSSILGSAIIACLSRILGQKLTLEELFNRTLYMEQLMTTCGGWQDQIGGVVGGVKHIQTKPDLFQIPKISWTNMRTEPDMRLSERFLLYYTGYRRMARNILRNIVGKYLDRDEITIKTIGQLREKSFEMKVELDYRDIDAFGKKVAEVWELNKTLDPGTSNDNIESIIEKILHLIHGAKLLGAGGGGFLFIVTKGVEQSKKIREILEKEPPNDRARFFDFDVDQDGLKVSVL